jgi:hypothetical protein
VGAAVAVFEFEEPYVLELEEAGGTLVFEKGALLGAKFNQRVNKTKFKGFGAPVHVESYREIRLCKRTDRGGNTLVDLGSKNLYDVVYNRLEHISRSKTSGSALRMAIKCDQSSSGTHITNKKSRVYIKEEESGESKS